MIKIPDIKNELCMRQKRITNGSFSCYFKFTHLDIDFNFCDIFQTFWHETAYNVSSILCGNGNKAITWFRKKIK